VWIRRSALLSGFVQDCPCVPVEPHQTADSYLFSFCLLYIIFCPVPAAAVAGTLSLPHPALPPPST
jgi:hypothetical protein